MHNSKQLEHIRQFLGLKSLDAFSLIVWRSPKEPPEPEEGVLCQQAAYENGRFWYLDTYGPVEAESLLGWTYPPYDDRLGPTGAVIH